MPKYRSLHAKILDSFDFNDMPNDFTRLFWVLLPLILDSEGRAINNTAWIRSRLYPLREDITNEQVANAMIWLSDRKMIGCYTVDGHQYFFVPTFKEYQRGTEREASSVLPGPTPELLASYSRSNTNTDSYTDTNTEAETETVVSVSFRSNIIDLYTQYIGEIRPAIRQTLINADKEYSPDWIPKAFEIMRGNDKKSWSYVEGTLKNWQTTGKPSTNGHKPKPSDLHAAADSATRYAEWEKR